MEGRKNSRMNIRITSVLLTMVGLALLASASIAQLPVPDSKPITGARMPALSPDGKKLAFVYRGDIWVSDSTGGHAAAITRNVEMDAFPQFSPDGNWVAFSSTRNGNWDIYVVPATGGTPKRLTYHASSDISYGWSPDGKSVLFCSRRDTTDVILYTIDVKTLKLHKLAQDYVLMNFSNFSPDGSSVLYSRNSSFHWSRPRYVGSGASQMWILDVNTGKRHAVAPNDRQQLWPRFLPGGSRITVVTIGDVTPSSSKLNESTGKIKDTPARTPNLWIFDTDGKGKQVTQFTGGSVRFPTVATTSGDIAFEYDHDLWFLHSGEKEPIKIPLYASQDDAQNTVHHEQLNSGATEIEPSPDGKSIAFGLHGDIWTILADKPKGVAGKEAEIAHRLTDWAGDDSDFVWSSDGKKLYFCSDREFNTRLYEMDAESGSVKPIWFRPEDVSRIKLSPDGKQLGFWVTGPEGGLYVMSLDSNKSNRLVRLPGIQHFWNGGGDFSWSPDMQWIAYARTETNAAWNIWVVPAAGGESINVTKLNAYHAMPTWSPDGKYLFFQSDRDDNGLYVLPLTKEPGRISDIDITFEKPKEPVKVTIDFDDIDQRIRKLASQTPQESLTVTDDGRILFISDNDIWSVSYDGKDTRRLTSGGGCGNLRTLKDNRKAFYTRNGELWTINLDDPSRQDKVNFTADWDMDVRAERKAAFAQFWRSYNRLFYDPNMHGRDWNAIRERYEPILDAVETREEFATLLSMMIGELECSHSEVSPAPGGNPTPVTPHLGFTFDYSYAGPGIRVDEVPAGSPGSFEKTRIKPGEYIVAINGQDVNLDENLFKLINDKQGREFEFLVNAEPSRKDARTVKYTCMTWPEWDQLNYDNRTERLRKYVEAKSGGKVGYVHISRMMGDNQTKFEREFYEYALGKSAMIIDVRFNGGGNIADGLVDWLERKPHGYAKVRDGETRQNPGHAWDKPIIVLMNEQSLSNAEMFPDAMRTRGLAKLVGMPTPGYVISTYDLPLVDGTKARMPFIGQYRLDGTPMENVGEQPDVRVPMSSEDWLSQKDPQLDKALELLKKDIR